MGDGTVSVFEWAHPIVREWFETKFATPTEPQQLGWPEIIAGRTTLIAAPTGSGKTLAAFLACIERLVRKAVSGRLQDRTEVLYVSPLRALSNDIQKNLQGPLSEILQLAWKKGTMMSEIRTCVRTGDTPPRERQAMLKRPPHILVTTPESLYILLTAEKSREILKNVETVIVDEIHAVADDKRGAHLALSLERLDHLVQNKPVRIGLSATQKPIHEIAQFLAGAGRPEPVIVDVGHKRALDLSVVVPDSELGPIASHELWDEIHEEIAGLVNSHRSTLIFVNTRKLAERTAHRLAKKLGEEAVAAHHGSLSRKIRLAAEKKLKNGELKALVATASLELGIDVGTIDLVCQIGSSRSIAVALQRIGRSGHWRGAVPRGRLFPTTRDELIECAALVRGICSGELDRLYIPESPLDILAQQIVATCSSGEWDEDELFAMICRAYPYRNLPREKFNAIVEMLSDGIASNRGRFGAHLHRDRVQRLIRPRRGTRLIAITSGGAIPETGNFTVVTEPDGIVVGTLDEDFAVESNQGDIILLGSNSWRIRRVQSPAARVLVEDAHGAPPTIPFWRGEAPARTSELSAQVAEIRSKISEFVQDAAIPVQQNDGFKKAVDWLMLECKLDRSAAEQVVCYLLDARSVLGALPTQKTVIAERFFDESGGMQLVIHAPFGARINKAWGLALRKRFCRSFNLELQAAATDDGLNISLTEQHSFPLESVFRFVHPDSVENILTQAAFASPLFGTRWRWDAMRSLALTRFQRGKKVPLYLLRMRAEDLLAAVFPDAAACQDNIVGEIQLPDHPLVNETMKDVLQEAMDLEGLKGILQDIYAGKIQCLAVDTPIPSPLSHEILNANPYAYLDDAPLEERRARAVSLRRVLPAAVVEEVGMLSPVAIAQVKDQLRPDIRSADEMHDLLLSLEVLSPLFLQELFGGELNPVWAEFLDALRQARRMGVAVVDGAEFWFAAERYGVFKAAYPNAGMILEPAAVEIGEKEASSGEDAAWRILRGWMPICGPVTVRQMSEGLKLPLEDLETAMLRLESSGAALRGKFIRRSSDEKEWCDRRILARIHRMTLGALRKEIEPVTAAQFMRWLTRWQHAAPGTQVHGERGLLEVLRQLQGFEIPARAWESEILKARVADYNPSMLDQLCWKGLIGWGRFSSPSSGKISRRAIPGSAAPITFFLREECHWMPPYHGDEENVEPAMLSDNAEMDTNAVKVYESLKQRGASFVADLVRFTGLSRAEVEESLWQLVTLGRVTADGFDSLRTLLTHRRKPGASARAGAGRWARADDREKVETENRLHAECKMLLNRYGVVFRDIVQRESLISRWRELLTALRIMEDRGEVRGGRFIDGISGEQFALPLAVDSLRAMRKVHDTDDDQVIVFPSDPLNLVGLLLPGERISAVSRAPITFRSGIPLPNPSV